MEAQSRLAVLALVLFFCFFSSCDLISLDQRRAQQSRDIRTNACTGIEDKGLGEAEEANLHKKSLDTRSGEIKLRDKGLVGAFNL